MELRKLLAVLLDVLKLLVRRESLLAIGVITVIVIALVRIAVQTEMGNPIQLAISALVQWGMLFAAALVLGRVLAPAAAVRGKVQWLGWSVSAVVALLLNLGTALFAAWLIFRPMMAALPVGFILPVLMAVAGLAMLAWFVPLVHLVLAARGDRRFAPGSLPGALAPARFAWLAAAFLLGTGMAALRAGLVKLAASLDAAGWSATSYALPSLGAAIEMVATLALVCAAANYLTGDEDEGADVFA